MSILFAFQFRLQTDAAIGVRAFRGGSITHKLGVFRVLVVSVLVRGNEVPTEMSKMTPALENHSPIKKLSLCGDDHAVVLAVCPGIRFAPMEFKRLEF